MNAIVILKRKNPYSWGKSNLIKDKGFIFRDKDKNLKEAAAKIANLSHQQIYVRPST